MKHIKNNTFFIFMIVMLVFASLACGSSNEGTVVTPVAQSEVQATTPAQETEPNEPDAVEASPREETTTDEPAENKTEQPSEDAVEEVDSEATKPVLQVFEVGDLIEVEDHTIRLNSVSYNDSMVIANFTIENQGDSDLNVSSLISYSAKNEDGTLLEQEYFDCGTSSLDGTVLPGDKLRGDICWTGANPDAGIKLYYAADIFGQGAVVWNAAEGVAEELESAAGNATQIETFQLGDLVAVEDHTIRLNSVTYTNGRLMADFTFENTGSSDLDLSSMLSFTAKNADGVKLEDEFFDCGESSLDGKVLPGDRLRGLICWSGAAAEDGIKLYYEANLFGEGAVVWEAVAGNADPLEVTDAQLQADVYQVGDLIETNDHTVILNSTEFQGDMIKANFTLENLGTEDLNVSSLLSFYARNREGYELEQEYFDCGTSLDGSVIPGDKLTGDICWVGTQVEDGIKLYYEPELFSSGAIVWQVE